MNALISIIPYTNDEMHRRMLILSLSFIHPMKKLDSPDDSITIILYDCSSKIQVQDSMTHLCEVSSVDFQYQYRFI